MKNIAKKNRISVESASIELKYAWTKAEADMIRGLKRHLQTPIHLKLKIEHVEVFQTTVRYYRPEATITQLWDFPISFWKNVEDDIIGKEIFLHEIMQCLNYLMTRKIISADSSQHWEEQNFLNDSFRYRNEFDQAVHFKEVFSGYTLKDAALKKDISKIKLLADLMGKERKSFVGVYNILLNERAFDEIMALVPLCGEFECVDFQKLFMLLTQQTDSEISHTLEFKRFCIPYFRGWNFLLSKLQEYSLIDDLLIAALDAGVSPDQYIKFVNLSLPAWKYFHFLGEIEPELSPLLEESENRLAEGLRAAKLYCEWEKKHPMTM